MIEFMEINTSNQFALALVHKNAREREHRNIFILHFRCVCCEKWRSLEKYITSASFITKNMFLANKVINSFMSVKKKGNLPTES